MLLILNQLMKFWIYFALSGKPSVILSVSFINLGDYQQLRILLYKSLKKYVNFLIFQVKIKAKLLRNI